MTGAGAVEWAQQQRASLHAVVDALKVNPSQAVEAIERLQADSKRLAREVSELKTKLATGGGGTKAALTTSIDVGGRRSSCDADAARTSTKTRCAAVADSLSAQIKSGIVVLASPADGKVQIVVAVTPDLTSRIKAGQIVKELAPIVGGAGGGRPDFAEAGGKQPEKIDEMLGASQAVIARLLGA